MPQFQYVALNRSGREVRGAIDAGDSRAAAATLRSRSLYVLDLDAAGSQSDGTLQAALDRDALTMLRWALSGLRPIRARDRIFFLQQLALMLRNGLTLLQALEVSREQTSKRRFRDLLGRLADGIQSGISLSQAMAREGRYFSNLTVKLVESAEASGELDAALERAAEHLERNLDLRRRLLTSLTYPAIVVLTSIAVVVFLVWKVIPKFADFFARRGTELPWSTQFLLDLSAFVIQYGPALGIGLASAAVLFFVAYATRPGRLFIDRAMLKTPVIGRLLTVGGMVHLSGTLAILLQSGVTLLEALRIASQVSNNRAFSDSISQAADQVLRGQDLAGSLRQPVIPPLVSHVVAVGERTGALGQVLEELGEFYNRELQAHIRRMSALVEPVMILTIGGIVGFVYFAFFQAVFQLAQGGG